MSAILLHKSGMSREYIIADFMKTASNLEAYLAQFASERPGIRLDVITPHERYMEELLAWLSTQRKTLDVRALYERLDSDVTSHRHESVIL